MLVAGGVVATSVSAQDERRPEDMMLVAASTLLGADVVVGGASDASTTCRDFLVDLRTGELTGAVLDDGLVVPAGILEWDAVGGGFATQRLPLAGTGGRGWDDGPERSTGDSDRIGRILLADLIDLPLRGARSDDGNRVELGALGGALVDVANRRIRFVTVSVGGVLGIGADAKVVPWGAMDIVWSDTDELVAFVPLNAERLEAAPTAEKGQESVADPKYRDRVYSFFGVDRPESDRRGPGTEELVTIRRWIGVQVATAGEGRVTVEDVLIGREKDSAVFLRLDNGLVTSAASAEWTSTEDGTRALKIAGKEERVAASELISGSALLEADVIAGGNDIGSVQNLYCREASGAVAFVTIEIGGILGFGGVVKAVPWRLFRVATRDGDSVLLTDVSAERLRDAPSVSDEPAGSIYSPGFRERVEAFADGVGGGR